LCLRFLVSGFGVQEGAVRKALEINQAPVFRERKRAVLRRLLSVFCLCPET